MANRTVKEARNIHGTNPQYLIEKIIRSRIYDSKYWKEQCFALTAELLVDKAMELRYIGGVYGGNIKPTQFLCLTLKMLQIQPEKDIIVEFIKNEEFKYVRALGAFYLRLTGTSLDCYKYLEPLYNDNRKLRRQNRMGHFEIVYMDDFIDELLRNDRVCDIILPRIQKRSVLEENNELEPKVSALDEDLDEDIPSDDEIEKLEELSQRNKKKKRNNDRSSKSRSRSKSREERGDKRYENSNKKRNDNEKDRERERGGGGGEREWEEKEREKYRRNRERDREREFRERSDRDRDRGDRERDRKDRYNRYDHDERRGDYDQSDRDRRREKDRKRY